MVIFIAFSIGCGFAQTIDQLIVCRTFQGVGGAAIYSLSFVILLDINTEMGQRNIAAIVGGILTMAGIFGPILGGVITNLATWRVSSLLQMPHLYFAPVSKIEANIESSGFSGSSTSANTPPALLPTNRHI